MAKASNNRFMNMWLAFVKSPRAGEMQKSLSAAYIYLSHLHPALYDIAEMINFYLCLQAPKRDILNDAINYRGTAAVARRCHLLIGT
jgi:hypothetical protein